MKRAYSVCLVQLLAATFLLSQSNSLPLLNHMASVVSPSKTAQSDPTSQARILDSYECSRVLSCVRWETAYEITQ